MNNQTLEKFLKERISSKEVNVQHEVVNLCPEPKATGLNKLHELFIFSKNDKNLIFNGKILSNIISDIEILISAYEKIKSIPGNMTAGSDKETLDGINYNWFVQTSKELKSGEFKFHPARRVGIPKPKGGIRYLGVASPRDKIVQEAMRMVLESIYEPHFKNVSHGFRPGRSCHSALLSFKYGWGPVSWFIEGDISKCFDSFDHNIIIDIINFRIKDQIFIDLLYKALKAGYIHQRKYFVSDIGTPQGSLISPILCNILLDKFDEFILEFQQFYNIGQYRKTNKIYTRFYKNFGLDYVHKHNIPKLWIDDPNFKRLYYVRYADDFIIGISGPYSDCCKIRNLIKNFLYLRLKLDLNLDQSKITSALRDKAQFLGAQIYCNPKKAHPYRKKVMGGKTILFRPKVKIVVNANIESILKKLVERGIISKSHKPIAFNRMIPFEAANIVHYMNSMWLGIKNYYSFADNYSRLGYIYILIKFSCMHTLSRKFKLGSLRKGFKKFGSNIEIFNSENSENLKKNYPIASFPKINSLAKISLFKTNYNKDVNPLYKLDKLSRLTFRSKIIFDKSCSICGSLNSLEMHHVKHLRRMSNKLKLDYWTRMMSQMNRKQIVVCKSCHNKIHKGEYFSSLL